jgi:hypothetical protein
MKPTGSNADFERRLERELRLHVASAQGPSPRAAEPAYLAASRRGGQSLTTLGILGKGAAGLVAAVLTVGGGSAVAMAATGSHNPGELVQSVAQIVEGCKDNVRVDDHDKGTAADVDTHTASATRNNHGIGHCVSSQVNHNRNGERHQQANGVTDADERKTASPSTSPGTHQDHGQGNGSGSVGAPGQGGSGNGTSGQSDHGKPGDNGHKPSPSPHP